jgi:glycerol uptake facilitator-like aquaporin
MTKFRPLLAEFIGTFALIFVGIGAIKTAGHDVLAVALAHGLTIAAFVSATLHISGGQLNPAVTFGLLCGGHMKWPNALRYWTAQCLGGIYAALICLGLFGRDVVITGTPQLAINLAPWQGIWSKRFSLSFSYSSFMGWQSMSGGHGASPVSLSERQSRSTFCLEERSPARR